MNVVEHCSVADIRLDSRSLLPLQETALNSYLVTFAKPLVRDIEGHSLITHIHCINCRIAMTGSNGSFHWLLAHGEGECRNCHWPVRGIHYAQVGSIKSYDFRFLLCYHPDEVLFNAEQEN